MSGLASPRIPMELVSCQLQKKVFLTVMPMCNVHVWLCVKKCHSVSVRIVKARNKNAERRLNVK